MKRLQQQKGFTLVELAIVLTIIGLLIGGILKGQQLIANARVTAEMAQVQGITAAVTTFNDTYQGLPGDLTTATTRVPNCTAANNCGNGDGNGQVQNVGANVAIAGGTTALAATGVTATEETVYFWTMLDGANLISGSLASGTSTAGGTIFPPGKVGGSLAAATGTDGYLYIESVLSAGAVGTQNTMTPGAAAQIDRKMDDGDPLTGSAFGNGLAGAAAADCISAAAAPSVYDETNANKVCDMAFRINQ